MFTVTTMTMRTARLVTPAVTTAAASIAAIDMEQTLTQLPFWSSLTEQEQETLRRSAFVRHYEKGAFIHSSDNECLGMLFVLSGEIRTYLLSEEGREVTLFRLYPGELCVLSASCVISQITFDTQMTAGSDTDVLISLHQDRTSSQPVHSASRDAAERPGEDLLDRYCGHLHDRL